MQLSRPDIKKLLRINKIFTPLLSKKLIKSCSIDLPLDNKFYICDAGLFFQSSGDNKTIVYRERNTPVIYGKPIKTKSLVLMPGAFVLACSKHIISIPNTHVAHVSGTSSLGRICTTAHVTANRIDPGFKGKITLEIQNNLKIPITLQFNDIVASLEFRELSTPEDIGYSQKKDSTFPKQAGPVPFGGQIIDWSKIRSKDSYIAR